MTHKTVLVGFLMLAPAAMGWAAQPPAAPKASPPPASTGEAAEHQRVRAEAVAVIRSALPLLQSSADTWIQRKSCTSCHHQTLGLMAVGVARENGFDVHDGLAAKQTAHLRRSLGRSNIEFGHGIGPSTFGAAFGTWGMHLGEEADRTTPVRTLAWLLSMQQENGQLPSLSHRPPMEHRSATGTALLIHAIRRWGGHLPAVDGARARAARWLDRHAPTDTESAAWRLLGLYWQGRSDDVLQAAARPLLDEQQADGAWRQHQFKPSDAYATALALASLLQTGTLEVGDARALGATRWLVQAFDHDKRAWHVTTRRRVEGLPYFESGYPFGEDQFISYAASAWATTAMALFLRGSPSSLLEPPEPAMDVTETSPCDQLPSVLCAARWGTIEHLARQIDRTAGEAIGPVAEQGLHLLMASAVDPAKLSLVLNHWPESVDLSSELGRTALHLATLAPDPLDAHRSVDLLLRRGADPNVADRQGLTPLHLAARRADGRVVERLLKAGAEPTALAAGVDGMSPLGAAIGAGAIEVVAHLLRAGADPGIAMNAYGTNALQEAVYADQPEIAEMLVADPARAKILVSGRDLDGWSAAHYLFLQPFGESRMAAIVLGAGADLDVRDNEGRSVRDLASREDLQVLLGAARVRP